MAIINSVEDLYRQPYEGFAAIAWAVSAIASLIAALAIGMPWPAAVTIVGVSLAMAVFRAQQTIGLVDAKINLAGREWWSIKVEEIAARMRKQPKALWLGRGFEWTSVHTERAVQLNRLARGEMLPPKWLLKLLRRPHNIENAKGAAWIHGLEPKETELYTPWDHAEGNWKIFGTTGAGKTRLYEVLLYQMVARNDVVIIIDPKFDKDLLATARAACAAAGRPDALAFFHPAMPTESVRLDLMANYTRETELATRMADIVGGEDDNFKAFVWNTVHSVNMGLIYCGERPSFRKVRFYVEQGPEELLERVLTKFFRAWRPGGWEDLVAGKEQLFAAARKQQPKLKTGSPRLQAMAQVYTDDVPTADKADDVTALLSVTEHSREHLGKMIAGFKPQVTKLTAGSLGPLLSPDYDDPNDEREILDTDKLIRGKRVLYFCTDSLPDAAVGSTLAGILVSDVKAAIGARYNTGAREVGDSFYIHVLGDEASEWVNDSAIALANKGRGAGVITWFAAQNFSDYVVKLGSEERARMLLGNCNNTICLRVTDTLTQDYIVSSIGDVATRSVDVSKNASVESETGGMEFGTSRGVRITQTDRDLFPGFLLGRLGDLGYVSITSGGLIRKGRLGKLTWPKPAQQERKQ